MIPSSSIVELITQHDLFRGFSQSLIERVVQQSEVRQLGAGEVLIEYGQQNSTLYVLLEGELQIILEKEHTQFSISIEPGECIGEMSLVEEKPTSAKAIAYQASQVLAISDTVFWEYLAVSRQGVKNLMRMMADRLHRNNEALIKKIAAQMQYDQLERDLATAGKIQANIVPDGSNLLPGRSELDVFACSRPARAVGGDFYDALALDQDHIYLAIGDATGKGMPAALFMMRTFTSLRFLVSNYPSFANVMPALNNTLARKNEDMMFASIWAGILNVKTGILQCVNGGHHPPYARLGGQSFTVLPPPNGPIVGVVEDARFEVASMQLQAGDTIFLYTDGLPEALSPEQEAFEAERILAALNRRPNASLHDLIQEVQTQVDSFVQNAPTHDDLTMLAFRYNGHEGNSRP